MRARYVRISTPNQKVERQLKKSSTNERLYIDVVSGAIPFIERPKGKQLIEDVIELNISNICVPSIDRLGRNLFDILNTLDFFYTNNVNLKVDNLGIESMIKGKQNPAFKLIVSVMANIAEMERETLLERQKEGIALAKAKGTYKGRVRGSRETRTQFLSKYKNVVKYLRQGQSLRNTSKLCGVSLGTVQKVKGMIDKN